MLRRDHTTFWHFVTLPGTEQQFRIKVQLKTGLVASLGMQQHNQEQNVWFYRLWTQGGATRASISALLIPAARLVVAQSAYCEGAIFARLSYIISQFWKNIFLSKKNYTILLLYARHLLSWKGLQSSYSHSHRWPQKFSSNHLISVAQAAFGKDPVVYLRSPTTACPTAGAISARLMPGQITVGVWPTGTDKTQAKYTPKGTAAESALGPVLQQPAPATRRVLWELGHTLITYSSGSRTWSLGAWPYIK